MGVGRKNPNASGYERIGGWAAERVFIVGDKVRRQVDVDQIAAGRRGRGLCTDQPHQAGCLVEQIQLALDKGDGRQHQRQRQQDSSACHHRATNHRSPGERVKGQRWSGPQKRGSHRTEVIEARAAVQIIPVQKEQ